MNPPIPDKIILILSVVLPIVYQAFLSNLPGLWKSIACYILSGIVGLVCSIFILNIHDIGGVITNILWIIAASNIIYDTLIKTLKKWLVRDYPDWPLPPPPPPVPPIEPQN
jgi:hypothetical protein